MSKKLLYIFGPDGAGKSTIANELVVQMPRALVFNASHDVARQ